MPTSIALSLGANLGARRQTLVRAIGALRRGGLREVRVSRFYETEPVSCKLGAPLFVNCALTATWCGAYRELLVLCQSIEATLGRPFPRQSDEARAIDIDILLLGNNVLHDPILTVPHPRMTTRLFVLVPLAEIAPGWVVPGLDRNVAELRDLRLAKSGEQSWGREFVSGQVLGEESSPGDPPSK